MTITEWLRQRCLAHVCTDPIGQAKEEHDELVATEWSPKFEQLMRNRLLIGRFRYGKMSDPNKGKFDMVGSMIYRLRLYQSTGNLEHLVDVANLALVEFVHPQHPNAHFDAEDDGHHCSRLE